jgi:Cu-Zn family superoxide dismutase
MASALLAAASLVAGAADAQQKASADVVGATGEKVGEAILEQRDGSVQITATFTGLPPGEHAFHITRPESAIPRSSRPAGTSIQPVGSMARTTRPVLTRAICRTSWCRRAVLSRSN